MTDLRSIFTEHYRRRGRLVPQEVVDEAADPAHPLHDQLEWDDEIAGNAYRCNQVAEKIRSVKLVYREATAKDGKRSVREWVAADTVQDIDREGYLPVEEVLADPFAEKLLLRELEREMASIKRKYGHLKEFATILKKAAS